MKATGIVRRIDDLGRIVIPKEIRRTMRIREGDPLEIFTNIGGEVVLKKHSSIGVIADSAEFFIDILKKFIKYPVLVVDKDSVICTSGVNKREYVGRRITKQTEDIINNRKPIFSDSADIVAIEGDLNKAFAVVPITSINDIIGALIVLDDNGVNEILDKNLVIITSEYLGKQIED